MNDDEIIFNLNICDDDIESFSSAFNLEYGIQGSTEMASSLKNSNKKMSFNAQTTSDNFYLQ